MASSSSLTFLSFLLLLLLFSIAKAVVPPSETFRHVNEGEFGPYINEYDATYRMLPLSNSPFQLGFYNTTPNAYTLALRIGRQRQEPNYRWVWEANRGNPVRENATLSLASDGNLVLAEADGRVAWQTNTANKGVTGFKVLPNGNMVLHDARGSFVWQSFDHFTDTLLVGQTMRVGTRLVSRASNLLNRDGPYSMVLEPNRIAFYYKSDKSPKPSLYYAVARNVPTTPNVTFTTERYPEQDNATELNFNSLFFTRPKYDATYSNMRLDQDGNLRIYTYNTKVDYVPNEITFALFPRDSDEVDECQLPERCGNFGLCEKSQCVACPTPKGLMGWSKDCAAPKLASCKAGDFSYFKLVGVDHFLVKYNRGDGPIKAADCERKCTRDCRCLGYFYNEATSRCWIANDLKTLTRVGNSTHLGFIKAPKA